MQPVPGCLRHLRRAALAAALALPLLCGPALADRIFTFTQTGASVPPGVLTASGFLSLTDAAFESGVSIGASERSPALDWTGSGLSGLSFTVATSSGFALTAGLASLVPHSSPSDPLRWDLVLTSAPSGTPSGVFRFNTGDSDFSFTLNGASSFGSFNTDNPHGYPCTHTGTCSFTGSTQVQAQPVPEPMSAALFASGLAALGLLRLRRGTRPA